MVRFALVLGLSLRVYLLVRPNDLQGGKMKLLEERIRKDGRVKEGNVLKVDSFLNHQMDMELFEEMAKQ